MNQEKTNPGLAAILSFIFNGLGQFYNGQIVKGLLIIFLSVISMLILIVGAILIGSWLMAKVFVPAQIILGTFLFIVGLILICIVGIYSIFDAYRNAIKK